MTEDLTWEAPGDGVWWSAREHLPRPTGAMFATVFPPVTAGWQTGQRRFGLPVDRSRWAAVNGWFYFSPGEREPPGPGADDQAVATLDGRLWRDEVRRWLDEERPQVLTADRALQAMDVGALSDIEVAGHFHDTIAHFADVAPLHFEHTGFDIVAGLLVEACVSWGIEPTRVPPMLAGSSPASAAPAGHIDRIAELMSATGAPPPATLDDIRTAGADTAAALDAYLLDYGGRLLEGCDLSEPTLEERPEIVVRAVATTITGRRPSSGGPVAGADATRAAVRQLVPNAEHPRFDELVEDARASYRLRDDDVGLCWNWPLGLVRRAALELGRRLVARGALHDVGDITEATPAEAAALLARRGPSGDELAARAERRRAAARVTPPAQLGEPGPAMAAADLPPNMARVAGAMQALWSAGGAPTDVSSLQGVGIGTERRVGRARRLDDPDALSRVEPGDILVAVATTSAHNAIFPFAGAVATEEGGLMSHAAILCREHGISAVLGVPELLDRVHDGDLVEVDPVEGRVRRLDGPERPR